MVAGYCELKRCSYKETDSDGRLLWWWWTLRLQNIRMFWKGCI